MLVRNEGLTFEEPLDGSEVEGMLTISMLVERGFSQSTWRFFSIALMASSACTEVAVPMTTAMRPGCSIILS